MSAKTFIYSNSSIRVDNEPAFHRKNSKTFSWYANAESVWQHINWNEVSQRIEEYCHGTTENAKIIEQTLNILDKYTGRNRQKTVQPDDLAFGITQDLVNQLGLVSMGHSGAAQSLLRYILKDGMDSNIPGFSFENRMSEFIQRIFGNKSRSKNFDIKALETGRESVFVGESIMFYFGDYVKGVDFAGLKNKDKTNIANQIMEQIKIDFKNIVTYTYQEIEREIDGKIQKDIAVVAYKVPQKADISVPDNMIIQASYSPQIDKFINILRGSKISLKASTTSSIKLGSTNDNTRLRGFVSSFVENIHKDFATICTFIFASKNSKNTTVKKYLDWARILYELLGTGQRSSLEVYDNLLVDYLIITRYKTNGSSGAAIVFNVKDLIKGFPNSNYSPPFRIDNKNADENGKNSGSVVELNLGQAKNFVLSH